MEVKIDYFNCKNKQTKEVRSSNFIPIFCCMPEDLQYVSNCRKTLPYGPLVPARGVAVASQLYDAFEFYLKLSSVCDMSFTGPNVLN